MTPSFFRQIDGHCDLHQLKTLVLGGESFPSLSNATLQQMIKEGKRVINIYGLTEMSCWASFHRVTENDLQSTSKMVPLGQALDETRLRLEPVLDYPFTDQCFQMVLGRDPSISSYQRPMEALF